MSRFKCRSIILISALAFLLIRFGAAQTGDNIDRSHEVEDLVSLSPQAVITILQREPGLLLSTRIGAATHARHLRMAGASLVLKAWRTQRVTLRLTTGGRRAWRHGQVRRVRAVANGSTCLRVAASRSTSMSAPPAIASSPIMYPS